jgi:hypothetical protein
VSGVEFSVTWISLRGSPFDFRLERISTEKICFLGLLSTSITSAMGVLNLSLVVICESRTPLSIVSVSDSSWIRFAFRFRVTWGDSSMQVGGSFFLIVSMLSTDTRRLGLCKMRSSDEVESFNFSRRSAIVFERDEREGESTGKSHISNSLAILRDLALSLLSAVFRRLDLLLVVCALMLETCVGALGDGTSKEMGDTWDGAGWEAEVSSETCAETSPEISSPRISSGSTESRMESIAMDLGVDGRWLPARCGCVYFR